MDGRLEGADRLASAKQLPDGLAALLAVVLGELVHVHADEAVAELADRFVGMYVNELTCDYGDEGRQAVRELLARAEALGAYEQPVRVEFVG